jgi:DNA-directed RNA polymerase specialized sigma24 family protein
MITARKKPQVRGLLVVEVLRRYSNRSDLTQIVWDVLDRIAAGDQTDEPGVLSTGAGGGLAPVRERLGEARLAELAASRRAGASLRELAERFEVSLSSVKRLLRKGSNLTRETERPTARGAADTL